MFWSSDTFTINLFFRGFTITDKIPLSDNTFTQNNQSFVGCNFVINYENI